MRLDFHRDRRSDHSTISNFPCPSYSSSLSSCLVQLAPPRIPLHATASACRQRLPFILVTCALPDTDRCHHATNLLTQHEQCKCQCHMQCNLELFDDLRSKTSPLSLPLGSCMASLGLGELESRIMIHASCERAAAVANELPDSLSSSSPHS